MKIVIAPDSFKESLSAREAADAIAEGIRRVWHDAEIITLPMADGGEGTVPAVVDALNGELREVEVQGPLGAPVLAQYAWVEERKVAVIEMAEASGLELVSEEERDPMLSSTYGTGELIKAALDAGAEELLVGLGGSATIDGGLGALVALGATLHDDRGSELSPNGAALTTLARVDSAGLDPRLQSVRLSLACDVDNPLLGDHGAVMVYGPQKGATRAQQEELEGGMRRLARLLPEGVPTIPGSGAAGGFAAGLLGFTSGKLLSGVEYIADLLRLDDLLEGADLVFTGEGAINEQTAHGKTPVGVAKRASCPVIVLTGCLGDGFEAVYDLGISVCWPIGCSPSTLEESLRCAKENLTDAAERVTKTLQLGKQL